MLNALRLEYDPTRLSLAAPRNKQQHPFHPSDPVLQVGRVAAVPGRHGGGGGGGGGRGGAPGTQLDHPQVGMLIFAQHWLRFGQKLYVAMFPSCPAPHNAAQGQTTISSATDPAAGLLRISQHMNGAP